MERYTEQHCGVAVIKKNKTKEAAERLNAYESNDLTPEQIQELKERDTAKKPVSDGDAMICPVCGSTAYPWSRFCSECGQKWWED